MNFTICSWLREGKATFVDNFFFVEGQADGGQESLYHREWKGRRNHLMTEKMRLISVFLVVY